MTTVGVPCHTGARPELSKTLQPTGRNPSDEADRQGQGRTGQPKASVVEPKLRVVDQGETPADVSHSSSPLPVSHARSEPRAHLSGAVT